MPGGCPAGQSCGGAGMPNVCGVGICTRDELRGAEKNCGDISDGCSMTLHCGNCTTPQTCGGGGVANVCGCTPTTCAALGKSCGPAADGCGHTLDCGDCPWPRRCGGGGDDNVCGCTPTTCARAEQELRPHARRLRRRHQLRQRLRRQQGLRRQRVHQEAARARRRPPAIRGSAASSPTAAPTCSTAAPARRGSSCVNNVCQ